MLNKKFNRYQRKLENYYISNYGKNSDMSHVYEAKIKCKLLHSESDSIVFPDQIYLMTGEDEFQWIQPLTFLVNLLVKDGEIVNCGFFVDIPLGNTLKVEFSNKDLIKNLADNSSLFNCKIFGPENIYEYATGDGCFKDEIPYLRLYHHTLPRFKNLILKGAELKLSKWNIQGTKKLININYFYLTCLDSIKKNNDLKQIAMSSDGYVYLLLDNYETPKILGTDNLENVKNGVLELQVYRENTENRKATIEFLVDSTILAPKHLWKHYPNNSAVFYEVCLPYIFRIGGEPDTSLIFKNTTINHQPNAKIFNYQVVGDATRMDGLRAPYDEENTKHIFKVETLDSEVNILEFWFKNKNSDLFTSKSIDMQKFEKDK